MNELRATYPTGAALYALVFNAAGQVYDLATPGWENWDTAQQDNYDIPMPEVITNSGQYRNSGVAFPGITAGIYSVVLFLRAGTNPAGSDNIIGETEQMHWDGSAEIDVSVIDSVVDTIKERVDVVEDYLEFPNTWYVSKAGHGGTGVSWGDAFDTIAAAVAAAASGDKIFVGPGTYTEEIDLLTVTKSLTIEGIDRNTCILTSAAAITLNMYNECILRKMTVICTHVTGISVKLMTRSDVLIEDCILLGEMDGLYGRESTYLIVRRCKILGTWDAVNLLNATDYLIDDCFIRTDATSTDEDARAVLMYGSGSGIVRNSWIEAIRDSAENKKTIGVQCHGRVLIENCVIIARVTDVAYAGDVIGVYEGVGLASNEISINSCRISTFNASGGEVKDIRQQVGQINVINTHYDSTKVTGTIIEVASEARLSELDAANIPSDVDAIKERTDNLPDDPADQSQVESAISTTESNIRGADSDTLKTLSDQIDAVPTVAQIETQLSSTHGSGDWTGGSGSGDKTSTVTVTRSDTGAPIDGVFVWITTDLAGSNVVRSGYTNDNGVFTFNHGYSAGTTLYVWKSKAGYNFTNPVSAVTT